MTMYCCNCDKEITGKYAQDHNDNTICEECFSDLIKDAVVGQAIRLNEPSFYLEILEESIERV